MQRLSRLALLLALPTVAVAQNQGIDDTWQGFQTEHPGQWQVEWNAATGTPSAIFGPGLKLAGPVRSLDAARREARGLFGRYSKLLGKGDSEFVETIGVKVRKVYILVYDQRFKGLEVISGRADARINEFGVVALFGSRAVKIPAGFNVVPRLTKAQATAAADKAILGKAGNPNGRPAPRLVIWADTDAKLPTKATLAYEVQIDQRPAVIQVGKAYVDAATGALLQFKNEVLECSCGSTHVMGSAPHARRLDRANALRKIAAAARPAQPAAPNAPVPLTGKVMAWTNTGHLPTAALTNVPLGNLLVTSSAGNAYTDANGNFSIPYSGTSPVTVTATLTGRHSRRCRVAQGTQMSVSASVTPGTPKTLQFGTSSMGQFDRAQTTMYYFVNDTNLWLRALIPGGSTQINLMSNVNPRVNIASSCNAYYTSWTINHYAESSTCANTSYETVIQHELGHGYDHAFGGISQIDGLSEGWGDLFCIYRSRQPEVGPGFRKSSSNGIRTGTNTRTYPAGGGVHTQGQTWMGWAWDLRGYLMTTHGNTAGENLAHNIVIPSIAADATNQPGAVREVFIIDDNDGNLNNGTPNYNDLEKASLKRKLPYPKKVNPNAGSYTSYGKGCPGSGKSSGGCKSLNGNATALRGLTQNSNIFALGVPGSSGVLIVTGFELFTQAIGSTVNTTTQIHWADSAGKPTGSPVKTGTISIGTRLGWYKTTFSTPLIVPSGRKFFLSYKSVSSRMRFPIASAGTLGEHYWHPTTSTAWRGPFKTQRWAWRVNCATGGGATPSLSNNGVPELGKSFQVNLSAAKASSPALLLIGGSKTVWGSIRLPFDLTILGAKNCTLLASGEAQVAFRTSTVGGYSQNFNVPNNASLFGVKFFNQFVIEDSYNAFGLVFSNAGEGKIGKQ